MSHISAYPPYFSFSDPFQFLSKRWCAENLAFVEDVMR